MNEQPILDMLTEFLREQDCKSSMATGVEHMGNGRYNIFFEFPTNGGGKKQSEWAVDALDLMAFIWSKK